MSEGSFLSRWSRRKLQARKLVPPAEAAVAHAEEEAEITPEELARLPPIEDLTGTSDLAQFLRKGVPAVLRNAALRRVWALDPAIRDYVGDARDYAYDWNVPGGVPGSGALAEGDLPDLLKRVIGSGEATPDTANEPDAAPDRVEQESGPAGDRPEVTTEPAAQAEILTPEPSVKAGRRHGGALPV